MHARSRPFRPWRLAILSLALLSLGGWLILEFSSPENSDEATFETALSIHRMFNLVEGLVWLGVGAFLLLKSWKARKCNEPLRRPVLVAAVAFILFGISDFIEIRTGSWFQPIWLFAWNAICVVTLLGCWIVARGTREKILEAADAEPGGMAHPRDPGDSTRPSTTIEGQQE